jgi:hypothetical protein
MEWAFLAISSYEARAVCQRKARAHSHRAEVNSNALQTG